MLHANSSNKSLSACCTFLEQTSHFSLPYAIAPRVSPPQTTPHHLWQDPYMPRTLPAHPRITTHLLSLLDQQMPALHVGMPCLAYMQACLSPGVLDQMHSLYIHAVQARRPETSDSVLAHTRSQSDPSRGSLLYDERPCLLCSSPEHPNTPSHHSHSHTARHSRPQALHAQIHLSKPPSHN